MKKIIIVCIFVVILCSSTIFLHFKSLECFDYNKKVFDYFKDENLVGVDGRVNLSGVRSERDNLIDEVKVLFEKDSFDYNLYLKIVEDKKNNNDEVIKMIEGLSNEINELEGKRNSLNSEYNSLIKKYNSLKPTVSNVSVNNSYNFPLINQYPKYPTGCESVALTMLLRYYGINVSPEQVIDNLRKGSLPYYENGVRYGGNLEVEFVGNPYSKSSYGVYERPIADVANKFKSGINVRNNFPFSEVVNIVQSGTPVVAWTSMGLALPYISISWIYKPTMETINFKANEHAVVVIDANDSKVVIADPMGGKIKSYSRSLFEQRYNYFGRKALYY